MCSSSVVSFCLSSCDNATMCRNLRRNVFFHQMEKGEFTEILDDVSVEMIPVRYRWGCRTFQTASNIYVIHI